MLISVYFSLAYFGLMRTSGLHLVSPLYCCSSLLQGVAFDTSTSALRRLLLMSLTVVFGLLRRYFTMFLSSTAAVFLDLVFQWLLLRKTVVSLFFKTFQMVVLAMGNVCLKAVMDFPSSLSHAFDFHPDSFLVLMFVTRSTNCSFQIKTW